LPARCHRQQEQIMIRAVSSSHRRAASWILAVLACVAVTATQGRAQESRDVATVAQRYMDLTLTGRLEEAGALYATDLFFIDPTTDVFDFELAMGVEGPEAAIEVQRSWGIDHMEQAEIRRFVSGEHAVFYGPLTVTYRSGSTSGPLPFVTILRVRNGLIQERTDFGDYVGYTGRLDRGEVGAAGGAKARTARAYMQAYSDMRVESWHDLYGSSPVFQDPTLAAFGNGGDAVQTGADAIIAWFIENMQSQLAFELSIEDQFYTPSHAVFLTTVRSVVDGASMGGRDGPVEALVPMVTALTFEDGKIVGHRDYWDAAGWVRAIRASGADGGS
jgi:limonene-1,2-epoxide hydrolase